LDDQTKVNKSKRSSAKIAMKSPMEGSLALSNAALALFRLHVERRGELPIDDSNRAAYQELADAGLVAIGHSFVGGRNSIYGLTREGFERKAELLACAKEAG
jgi:hypothetical protein